MVSKERSGETSSIKGKQHPMAKKLMMKGAYMNGSGMSLDKKLGAKTVRLNFTMKWNANIANALGWTVPQQQGQQSVSLEGGMAVHAFAFEAGGKNFNLGSGLFQHFQVFRMEEEGKSPKFELRGQYTTHPPGIMAIAEKYADTTSRAEGELNLEYEKLETEGDTDGTEQLSLEDDAEEE